MKELIRNMKLQKKTVDNYSTKESWRDKLAYLVDSIQMASGMLTAYENNILILVDGFICSVAFNCASVDLPLSSFINLTPEHL
jgi:nicotinate-nucleotide--dimethylbenzimidazole phosphoribosyltransferase